MTDVYRCMVVTAADVALARGIAVGISPVAGANMWRVGVSPDGQAPATHYWDAGFIGPEWETLMPCVTWRIVYDDENPDGLWVVTDTYPGDPVALYGACLQYNVQVSQQQILDLFAHSDVTTQEPAEALQRMGLKLVQAGEP